jgi:hypothetical protein
MEYSCFSTRLDYALRFHDDRRDAWRLLIDRQPRKGTQQSEQDYGVLAAQLDELPTIQFALAILGSSLVAARISGLACCLERKNGLLWASTW